MNINWKKLLKTNRFSVCLLFLVTALWSLIWPKVGLGIINDLHKYRAAKLEAEANKDL